MPFWETVMDSPVDKAYGKRLIPTIVDHIAAKDPDRICFSFPRSSTNLQDGYRDMNFRTFSNAINKTAHFIRNEIGLSSMFETVQYMGYPDVRYFIVLVALMKTGHKVLFSSHSNSVAVHADLIKRTDCGIMIYTSGFPISNMLEHFRMEYVCMPELDYLLDDTPCQPYSYEKSFEEAMHQPCMVTHTSGINGYPGLVVWTHANFGGIDAQQTIPPLDERPSLWGDMMFGSSQRALSALPIFHGAGIASGISRVCFSNSAIVLAPSGLTSADAFATILDYAQVDSANCVPSTLEEIATRPDVLEKFTKLKYITYVGGSLSKAAGDTISCYTQLYAVMARKNVCTVVQHATDNEDWSYICLNPDVGGFEMRQHGDLYRLESSNHSPHLEEHPVSALFSKHPTKPHHWKDEGGIDVMVLF